VNSTLDIKDSFVILTRKVSWVMGMSATSIADLVVCFEDYIESTALVSFAFFPDFT
jgi:hypothetical protein